MDGIAGRLMSGAGGAHAQAQSTAVVDDLGHRLLTRTSWESRGVVRRFAREVSNERDWSKYSSGEPYTKGVWQSAVDPDADMYVTTLSPPLTHFFVR